MKVLIVPMAAMAETAGSFRRAKLLAESLNEKKVKVAFCAARDVNYKNIETVKKYEMSVPAPLGAPMFVAKHTFPLAQKLGIISRKTVHSFEEVLHLTGNLHEKYLEKSIDEIRNAIQDFQPDVVYSEFSISAIIAAKKEGVRLFATASVPTEAEYASSPKYTAGVKRVLKGLGLPDVTSALELLKWADHRFVPSCFELEPFAAGNITYCGYWGKGELRKGSNRKNIVVYMGNSLNPRALKKEILDAFEGTEYQVFLSGMKFKEESRGNMHMASGFNFAELLPNAALFINHGGQNSIMDGLIYGVPQLIYPGKVFERKYNAESIVRTGTGFMLDYGDFRACSIKEKADIMIQDEEYRRKADILGKKLLGLGGTENIITIGEKEYINEDIRGFETVIKQH